MSASLFLTSLSFFLCPITNTDFPASLSFSLNPFYFLLISLLVSSSRLSMLSLLLILSLIFALKIVLDMSGRQGTEGRIFVLKIYMIPFFVIVPFSDSLYHCVFLFISLTCTPLDKGTSVVFFFCPILVFFTDLSLSCTKDKTMTGRKWLIQHICPN